MSKLDIDERIADITGWNEGTVYKQYDSEETCLALTEDTSKAIKQLLRDVLNEVKPERFNTALEPGALIGTDGHGRVYANEAAMWANGMYNSAIGDMESRIKEIGL